MLLNLDMDERNQIIGDNLRKYRLLKGLTQEELADGFCSVSQLSKFENGKAHVKRSMLKQMADRLGVTVDRIETSDALQVELSEELQLARDACAAKNFAKAFEWVQNVIQKAREFGYAKLLADSLLLQSRLFGMQKQYAAVIEILEQALQERVAQDSAQRVQMYCELGEAYQNSGNLMGAYDCYCKADDDFEWVEEQSEVRLMLCYNLAKCQFWMYNNRMALRYAQKAEELAAALSKHVWRIRAVCLRANILRRIGQTDRAEELYLAALKEAQDNAMLSEVGALHTNYGLLLMESGDSPSAYAYFQRALKVFELLNETQEMSTTLLQLAELALEEEDLAEAEEHVERVLQLVAERPGSMFAEKGQSLRLLGRIRALQGKRTEQIVYLEQALQVFEQHQLLQEAFQTAVELAEAFDAEQDPRALPMFRQAARYTKQVLTFFQRS